MLLLRQFKYLWNNDIAFKAVEQIHLILLCALCASVANNVVLNHEHQPV